MNTNKLYRAYLAATDLASLCEKVGTKLHTFHIANGGTYLSGSIPEQYVDSAYSFLGEERLQALREERERIISDLLALRPESYVDRDGNKITWYCPTTFGELKLSIGEALCERVKVGERIVEKIDPDYLVDAPKVTVVEEQFEWRCSDDILGSMAHKEVAA